MNWHWRTLNMAENVVLHQENGIISAQWLLHVAQVIKTQAGRDGIVHVCTVWASKGVYMYTRPGIKLVPSCR